MLSDNVAKRAVGKSSRGCSLQETLSNKNDLLSLKNNLSDISKDRSGSVISEP